jgi:hypothetical protein
LEPLVGAGKAEPAGPARAHKPSLADQARGAAGNAAPVSGTPGIPDGAPTSGGLPKADADSVAVLKEKADALEKLRKLTGTPKP